MLVAYQGDYKQVNRHLILHSFASTPSLILDCGNAADAHSLFSSISQEQLHDVYVVNLEAIYRFRKGLFKTKKWIIEYKIQQLIVTTVHVLFSYDNPKENYHVLLHCWELLKEISKEVPVHIGIAHDAMHIRFAKRFADTIETIQGVTVGYYHTPRYAHGTHK